MAINRLIQGSLQSGLPKFDSVWDGRSAVGSMEPISAITLSAAQSAVEFNNIPQTYTHLQLRSFTRDGRTSNANNFYASVNGDTTYTNYYWHSIFGDGATAAGTAEQATGERLLFLGISTSASCNVGAFGVSIANILDYSNTSKFTVSRVLCGTDNNSATTVGELRFASSVWLNTNAVTSLTIKNFQNNNFEIYSSFSLYGIK